MTLLCYDELLFVGKPDLTSLLRPCKIFYESDLFPVGVTEPNEAKVREAAQALIASGYPVSEPVQLDVELYEWSTEFVSEAEATIAMGKMNQIMTWFRDEAPLYTNIGYYGIGPNRNYWAPQNPSDAPFATWQASNDFLAPLVAETTALFPSLYAFYNDRPGWVTYANANIAEAVRIGGGRPIYPFIWPRYHDGGDVQPPVYIDYSYWQLQLRTLRDAGVAGAILWGGYQDLWDPDARWWQATQDFLNMATFPSTLPEPLLNSYTVEPQATSIRTDMEAGPARVRQRFTSGITNCDVSWNLSVAQFSTFKTFYETTVHGGADWFDMTLDFGTGNATHDCRFVQPYATRPLGGGTWLVAAKLEARS